MRLLEIVNVVNILASMVYKFFDKKIGSGISINEQLAHELHKPVIEKFKRRKVYVKFRYNIWAANLAGMGSSSSKNKMFIMYHRCFH